MIRYILIFIMILFIGCASHKRSYLDNAKESFNMSFDNFYMDTISLFINNQIIFGKEVITNPRFDPDKGAYEDRPNSNLMFNHDSLIVSIEGRKKYIPNFEKAMTLNLKVKRNSSENCQGTFYLRKGRFFLIENFRGRLQDSSIYTKLRVLQFKKQPIKE